jgi:hypothetical protein
MAMKRRLLFLAGTLLPLPVFSTPGEPKSASGEGAWRAVHTMILPSEGDSRWMKVSWQPASNLWAARQKAAAEGKPLFLWFMAGEPLGPC